MEVNCKELCSQSELVDVASIEIPPEKLQEKIEIPEVKRKRGRPLGSKKKRTKPPGYKGPRRIYTVPAPEPWTSRLRQDGREDTLNKLKKNVEVLKVTEREEKLQLKRQARREEERCKYETVPKESICFVNVKEERHTVNADMTSHEVLDLYTKVKTYYDTFKTICPLSVKEENQLSNMQVLHDADKEEFAQSDRLSGQELLTAENSVHNESKTIDPTISDTQFTVFDVLCHSIMTTCRKPNSHQTQQQNPLRRFVKPRTSRTCDYIMATVAWHKLIGCNTNQERRSIFGNCSI